MKNKILSIKPETHQLLDVYRAKHRLKTFDEAIRRLLKHEETN